MEAGGFSRENASASSSFLLASSGVRARTGLYRSTGKCLSRVRAFPPVEPFRVPPGRDAERGQKEKDRSMGYEPFTNNYAADVQGQNNVAMRQAARRARINALMTNGNQVLGALTTECCSDPAYGGQSWIGGAATPVNSVSSAVASLVPGTSATSAASSTGAASSPPVSQWPLTPNDILTGTRGWSMQPNGKPWPRPLLPKSMQRRIANAYPNYGPTNDLLSLVPPCPCFSNAQPVVIPAPAVVTPAPNPTPAPQPPPGNCPYPGCSTGNVCLDLVTGCVSNSQVDPAQTLACTKAGYGTFGNSGAWLSAIMLGCGGNLPYLGTPLANPPQASGSMAAQLTSANNAGVAATQKLRGMSGLGQDDGSQLGGLLAIVAAAGILVWASKKW
jgi:hypothetical protein